MRWGFYLALDLDRTGAPGRALLLAVYSGSGGFVGAWRMLSQVRVFMRQKYGKDAEGHFFVGETPGGSGAPAYFKPLQGA
ncbi:MAG: hypothetical protein KGL39_03575 [Patescibacteria group bacterium]|nr:hypothetical protein [Patescibacteria group bacterium]